MTSLLSSILFFGTRTNNKCGGVHYNRTSLLLSLSYHEDEFNWIGSFFDVTRKRHIAIEKPPSHNDEDTVQIDEYNGTKDKFRIEYFITHDPFNRYVRRRYHVPPFTLHVILSPLQQNLPVTLFFHVNNKLPPSIRQ